MHNKLPSRFPLTALALALSFAGSSAHAVDLTATWTGAGDGANYSDPANWDINAVPLNVGTVAFDVIIPNGGFSVNFDVAGSSQVKSLVLGDNSRLKPLIGTAVTVVESAQIFGIADAQGGNFTASGPGTAFAGERGRAYAQNGGTVTIDAPTYSSKALTFNNGNTSDVSFTTTVFSSVGAGSVLDLSSVTGFDAGFAKNSDDFNQQQVIVAGGGALDLSRVASVVGPIDINDSLSFKVSDAGSHLDLSALGTTSSAGGGRIYFDVSAGGQLTLPELTSIGGTIFQATDGATLQVAGNNPAAYSTKSLTRNNGNTSDVSLTTNILTSTGPGTVLDLSAISNIDAGFAKNSDDFNHQQVMVSAGGTLDLSSVTNVLGPLDINDSLRFSVSGADSNLDLSALGTTGSAGGGRIYLDVSAGGHLTLPELTSISGTIFQATDGATLQVAGVNPASYSTKSLTRNNGNTSDVTLTTNILTSTGSGTVLDLSAIADIDAGFFKNSDDTNRQEIIASGGAALDLSGVTQVLAPNSFDDWIRFTVSDAGTALDLTSLNTTQSVGRGQVRFEATNGGVLELPALASINEATFHASNGGTLRVSGPSAAVYSSTELTRNNGNTSDVVLTSSILTSTGPGSMLDMSAVVAIDARFAPNSDDANRQEVVASNGGKIDLSGVTSVTGPIAANDWLRFGANDGGQIDLSSLQSVQTAGSGRVLFAANNGSSIATGSLDIQAPATAIDIGGGSTMHVGGDLKATGAGAAAVRLSSAEDRLQIGGSLDLATNITLVAAERATVAIGGDLSYATVTEANMDLGGSILQMNGSGGVQQLEVGGLNVDTFTSVLSNSNFGFGQLQVGTADTAAKVELFDLLDNGNRASGDAPESLYLFGLDDGADGLHILGGSTLFLAELPAFAELGGSMVDLYSLFPNKVVQISFDGGFLNRGSAVPLPAPVFLLFSALSMLYANGIARRRRA